ncbi:MAG: hypothetical protein P8046_08140 [Anaerolineales bacterium]
MDKQLLNFDIDKRWDYENGFYITSEPARIGKAIAQYELYRSISSLSGHVLEFGIFKGASFIRLAAYREILESQASRKLIGFDIFGKFPVPEDAADQEFVTNFVHAAGDGISQKQFSPGRSCKLSLNRLPTIPNLKLPCFTLMWMSIRPRSASWKTCSTG